MSDEPVSREYPKTSGWVVSGTDTPAPQQGLPLTGKQVELLTRAQADVTAAQQKLSLLFAGVIAQYEIVEDCRAVRIDAGPPALLVIERV
jgi:hypothetical protein